MLRSASTLAAGLNSRVSGGPSGFAAHTRQVRQRIAKTEAEPETPDLGTSMRGCEEEILFREPRDDAIQLAVKCIPGCGRLRLGLVEANEARA